MTTEQPDPYITKLEAAERELRSLQDDVALSSVHDTLSEIDSQLRDLPGSIQRLRARGYVFKKYLETKAEVLAQQWGDMRWRVIAAVDEQARHLRVQADSAQLRLSPLRGSRDENELASVAAAVDDLESRARTAKDTIYNMYSPLRDNINQTLSQLKDANWALDQVDGAAFKLYPGEGVVAAVKAQWMTGDTGGAGSKEGPKGIFYLTEDRVLFEQKEEIATKKMLFITTAKEKVQELKWQAAIGQVVEAKASEEGGAFLGIGKKEVLSLSFDNRVPVRTPPCGWRPIRRPGRGTLAASSRATSPASGRSAGPVGGGGGEGGSDQVQHLRSDHHPGGGSRDERDQVRVLRCGDEAVGGVRRQG